MLTIRLARVGKKKHSLFRVIISEKSKDTVGNYLELLGHYNPHTNQAELKADRIKYWISKGAQTSGTIHNLLIDHKIISGEKIKVANIKKKKEEKKEEKTQQPEPLEKPTETKGDPETSSGEEKKEVKPVADKKSEETDKKPKQPKKDDNKTAEPVKSEGPAAPAEKKPEKPKEPKKDDNKTVKPEKSEESTVQTKEMPAKEKPEEN